MVMRDPSKRRTQAEALAAIQENGMLLCMCSSCELVTAFSSAVVMLVETNFSELVCPHCRTPTLTRWGRINLTWHPEVLDNGDHH